MITTETPSVGGTPRGVHGGSSRGRAKVVVPIFLLTAVFIFTGAPTATAAAVLAHNDIAATWEPSSCRGDKPGVCPYYYSDQPDMNISTPSDEQDTTLESSTS
ncbi:MAG: hypothetical protein ACRES5_33115 [Pseudomonas sp.]